MTLIEQIATYLETQEVGDIGTTLFISAMPDGADTCVAVFDTGGPTPDPYLPTRSPTFQVFIRAANYDTGKAKLEAVRAALHNKCNLELVAGQTYFYFIEALSEGGHIGRNERGLDEFSINFLARTR